VHGYTELKVMKYKGKPALRQVVKLERANSKNKAAPPAAKTSRVEKKKKEATAAADTDDDENTVEDDDDSKNDHYSGSETTEAVDNDDDSSSGDDDGGSNGLAVPVARNVVNNNITAVLQQQPSPSPTGNNSEPVGDDNTIAAVAVHQQRSSPLSPPTGTNNSVEPAVEEDYIAVTDLLAAAPPGPLGPWDYDDICHKCGVQLYVDVRLDEDAEDDDSPQSSEPSYARIRKRDIDRQEIPLCYHLLCQKCIVEHCKDQETYQMTCPKCKRRLNFVDELQIRKFIRKLEEPSTSATTSQQKEQGDATSSSSKHEKIA